MNIWEQKEQKKHKKSLKMKKQEFEFKYIGLCYIL